MLYCISVVPDIEEDMHEKCRFDLHLRIRCHGNFSGMVRADADSQRKLPVFRDEGAAFCGEKARTHGGGKHVAGSRFFFELQECGRKRGGRCSGAWRSCSGSGARGMSIRCDGDVFFFCKKNVCDMSCFQKRQKPFLCIAAPMHTVRIMKRRALFFCLFCTFRHA